jgi:hypothetical protein
MFCVARRSDNIHDVVATLRFTLTHSILRTGAVNSQRATNAAFTKTSAYIMIPVKLGFRAELIQEQAVLGFTWDFRYILVLYLPNDVTDS